ncbi:hypothetical protein Chor_005339 [Crotalus horridus]
MLLEYMSLSTSYWVLETTHRGMVHSGLWNICLAPKCNLYQFNLLGFLILVAMSVFTTILRRSPGYAQRLVVFGTSFSLGWASVLMYIITGILLLLTEKTIISLV